MAKHLLLVGAPGCGKTTVVTRVAASLRQRGICVSGFWTAEIRQSGARQGFYLEVLGGERRILAHRSFSGPHRVGRYRVDVSVMDALAVPEMRRAMGEARQGERVLLVIDEIGKMELCSDRFREAVLGAFDSPLQVLATIMAKRHPFADLLKRRPDVELITVHAGERDELPEQIVERFAS